ncbi:MULTISPECIES: alpha/beta fold hydrolase [Pseudomonas]|uniref:alpha/beta fold hydrolase n=1 Tax=Pseudomonas TaxID=286 RepID=UPI000F6F2306|nr:MULTISPECIES: alpha/beta fold hydrolase [Pseudomonas]AZF15481.1 Proline iminopeptidase [Pseudomonas sp. R3-18-08]AZF31487.1 Proline iminopeptidase [Pseudomonas sp. R4-35-07]AZF36765.1 Proline iminopeptidase [Pseudomonas sp. R4-39-08]MDQ0980261.1 proline iminopeptidase [Pseudomonas synxantha]
MYLHGCRGEGAPLGKRQFWDPDHYRIVLFDRRGALRSTPLGELRNNTTQALVGDLEKLREHQSRLITGGSWGTTLALAYGETHPQRCLGFILPGRIHGHRR